MTETPLENIRSLKNHYHDKKQEAMDDNDELAMAYHSGQISGLIHAEEAIKDAD